MPISGLVLTIDDATASRRAVLDALAAEPAVTPGAAIGHRLPVVTDTPDAETDRALQRRLESLPGVAHVDVTFVHVVPPRPAPSEDRPAAGPDRGRPARIDQP